MLNHVNNYSLANPSSTKGLQFHQRGMVSTFLWTSSISAESHQVLLFPVYGSGTKGSMQLRNIVNIVSKWSIWLSCRSLFYSILMTIINIFSESIQYCWSSIVVFHGKFVEWITIFAFFIISCHVSWEVAIHLKRKSIADLNWFRLRVQFHVEVAFPTKIPYL